MLSFSVSLLLACLLAVCPVQRSWGAIIEVPKFHDNPVSFAFDHHPSSSAGAEPSPREWKRQAGQLPHIDGTHQFNDGNQYGRIYYAGGSSQVIVVLSYDEDNGISYRSNLYRSTNYGSTFTNINGQVGSATLFQYFYWSGDTLIFVHSTESKLFYSNDQGATFTTVDLDPPTLVTTTVVYHPTRDGWMLMRDSTRNTLYLIEDYGKTLKEVQENVYFYQWGDAAWDGDDRRVYFMTADPNPNSDIEDETVNLYVSDYPYTGGSSEFDKNLGDHDGFLLVGRYIFAQRTDDGVIGLHVSDRRKPFKRAMIPVPDEHRNYLVIRINDVQALVIVEHAGGFYNLYLSDESGVYYSLSLRDLVIDSDYNIDLELIEGLNGTLVANQYTREDTSDLASSIRTVISLDNGGFWEGLLPPDEDINGDTINCEPPNCSLHLHMDSTNYARLGVYSTESAPGIIVAHGTIGIELSINPDLFISRDGGVTWEQTLAGSWGVNLADHGGLMVAAKDYHQEQSTVLKYSCNEGYSWRDFTFSSTDITVYGVVTEPGQHTTIMSLYGGSWDNFKWTVITVDFANIFPRQCDDQDYYDWRPWDERTESQCLLGSSITIERRKPQICCLNGRDYDREFDYHICDCTSEDYECDYGFARPMYDYYAPCMRDHAIELPNPCADGKNKTYMANTGYRKIAGDVCTGGEEILFQRFEAPCCGDDTLPPFFPPPNQPGQTVSGKVASKGPLAAVGALLGVACLMALVFLAMFIIVTLKYRATTRNYIRVATAEEPALFGSSQQDTPENLASSPLQQLAHLLPRGCVAAMLIRNTKATSSGRNSSLTLSKCPQMKSHYLIQEQ